MAMLYECRNWWQSHQYGNWGDPRPYADDKVPEGMFGMMQERTCSRCNARQVRVVDRLFRSSYDAGRHADMHAGV